MINHFDPNSLALQNLLIQGPICDIWIIIYVEPIEACFVFLLIDVTIFLLCSMHIHKSHYFACVIQKLLIVRQFS